MQKYIYIHTYTLSWSGIKTTIRAQDSSGKQPRSFVVEAEVT